jgi:hypothetical protein
MDRSRLMQALMKYKPAGEREQDGYRIDFWIVLFRQEWATGLGI